MIGDGKNNVDVRDIAMPQLHTHTHTHTHTHNTHTNTHTRQTIVGILPRQMNTTEIFSFEAYMTEQEK